MGLISAQGLAIVSPSAKSRAGEIEPITPPSFTEMLRLAKHGVGAGVGAAVVVVAASMHCSMTSAQLHW
jgi:hypothetical protein